MRQTGLIFGCMQTRRRHRKRRKADATSILATHVDDEHPSRWHATAPSKVREKSKYTALVEEEDEVGAKQFCEVSGKSSTLLNCSGMYCECYSIINFSYGICIVQGVTVNTNEAAGPAEGNVQWKEECCSC